MILRDLIGKVWWSRATLESDIFYNKPDKWFKIWFFLVSIANYKNSKQHKKGWSLTTYKEISDYTGATKNQIDHFIRWAKSATMIETRKTTRGMHVYIHKYSLYQSKDKIKSDTESDSKSEVRAKYARNTSDRIERNDNNDNNDNNLQPTVVATDVAIDPVNQIFNVFYESINPTINFGNKTSRKSAELMIKKFGFESTLKMAKYAVEIHGEKYAPRISTPHQLRVKIADLKAHFQQDQDQIIPTA